MLIGQIVKVELLFDILLRGVISFLTFAMVEVVLERLILIEAIVMLLQALERIVCLIEKEQIGTPCHQ